MQPIPKHFFPGISQLNLVVEVAAIVWYIVVRSTSINVRENRRGNQEWQLAKPNYEIGICCFFH
jgi:hypothetical protein